MLRVLVLLLILANAAAWAWHEGWLPSLDGAAAATDGSARRKAQINPDRLVILPPPAASEPGSATDAGTGTGTDSGTAEAGGGLGTAAAASEVTSASAAPSPQPQPQPQPGTAACLQAGPFAATERAQVAGMLEGAAPASAWALQALPVPGLWLVYMGPFADAEAVERKQVELRRIRNLTFEEVRSPASLALGISLGRYNQEEQAEAALEALRARGIRTARVVTVRPAAEQWLARVPAADEGLQRSLLALALPAGKRFSPCR